MTGTILSEIKTLFWLQWRLTRAMFRSRRTADRLQLVHWLWLGLQLLFTIPLFVLMGAGLAVGLILLEAAAAFEVAIVVNTFIGIVWLLLPASYNSQLIERFEMSRLFCYPVSFKGLVAGSASMAMVSMTGIWTIPILLGQVVGLAWHRPLALPLIVIGALPAFALLILAGRIVEDIFDLLAGDRRLRSLALFVLTLPFILLWLGQYLIQIAANRQAELPAFIAPLANQLAQASGLEEALLILQPSRFLIWLPPGWATAGMGLAATGAWGRGLLFLGLSLLAVAGLIWIHSRVTRALMAGAGFSIGTERVRSRQRDLRLPGPAVFWALLRKDWLSLKRSPLARRMLFSTLVAAIAMAVPLANINFDRLPSQLYAKLPFLLAAGTVCFLSLITNVGLMGNYYGSIDRDGFSILAQAGLDRRYYLISSALLMTIYTLFQYGGVLLALALFTQRWTLLPLGLLLAFCIQIGSSPAYHLASIIGPYRAQMQFSRDRNTGNLWAMLAWLISIPPIALLIGLPFAFWQNSLTVTLPLAVVYSLGLYGVCLKPLARLLQSREHTILSAISDGN